MLKYFREEQRGDERAVKRQSPVGRSVDDRNLVTEALGILDEQVMEKFGHGVSSAAFRMDESTTM